MNSDIHSISENVEVYQQRMLVKHTDVGKDIYKKAIQLKRLLSAYRNGVIKNH